MSVFFKTAVMIVIKLQQLWRPSPQIKLHRWFLQVDNSTLLEAQMQNGNFVKGGITNWVDLIVV
jgi:hypothetical protein